MHPQKKSYLIIRFLFIFIVFCLLICFLLWLVPLHGKYRSRYIGGCFALFFYFITMDYKNRCRKYVKFYDTYVRINAHHKKTILTTIDLDILYEDIRAIKVKKVPVLGVTSIVIDADNYGNGIKLHYFYRNFLDMCQTFYLRTTAFAPNVRIDDAFIDFLKRKKRI